MGSCIYCIPSMILIVSVKKERSNGAIPWLIATMFVIISCAVVFFFLITTFRIYTYAIPFLVQSGIIILCFYFIFNNSCFLFKIKFFICFMRGTSTVGGMNWNCGKKVFIQMPYILKSFNSKLWHAYHFVNISNICKNKKKIRPLKMAWLF